jgi:hypothetical protein
MYGNDLDEIGIALQAQGRLTGLNLVGLVDRLFEVADQAVFAIEGKAGALQQFVVQNTVTSASTEFVDVEFLPAVYGPTHALATVSKLPTASDVVTYVGAASGQYAQNLVYHKDAITFATADLLLPQGVDMASRQVHNGISMRVVRQYDINNDRMPCRIDVLYGYSVIRPQMACRIWG